MAKSQVAAKKIIDVQMGLLSGKDGSTPTSKVVAAVRGIAIRGPIHIMMMLPRIGASCGWTRRPRSLKLSPELLTDIIPIKGSKMPVKAKAKIVIQICVPICKPINGGRSKFPAPKKHREECKSNGYNVTYLLHSMGLNSRSIVCFASATSWTRRMWMPFVSKIVFKTMVPVNASLGVIFSFL